MKLGAKECTLDRAVFMFYRLVNGVETLVCVLGVHVDDVIGGYMPGPGQKVVEQIRALFEFGEWHADSLDYCGKNVTVNPDGSVSVCQKDFCENLALAPMPRWRSCTPSASLTPLESTELKSGVGSLQWLVGQTRPDLAASTSLCQGPNPTIQTLQDINGLLREAKRTSNFCLTLRPIDFRKACFLAFGDASWANAEQSASQAGFMIFLGTFAAFTVIGSVVSLQDWRSHRIRRVCRSTLAAECMAMDASVDSAMFLRGLYAEVLLSKYSASSCGPLPADFLPLKSITDCRSLFDLLTKEGTPSTTLERRLAIDIAALNQVGEEFDEEDPRRTFVWVPTDHQVADHLTKRKPWQQLRDILNRGWVKLVGE